MSTDDSGSKPGSALFSRWTSLVALAASLISLVVASVTLIYMVSPGLKPREHIGSSISSVAIEREVYKRDYLEMETGASQLPNISNIDQRGLLLLVRVDLQGFQRRTLVAIPLSIRSESHQRVGTDWACGTQTAAATTNTLIFRCWVAYAEPPGIYQIRTEIYQLKTDSNTTTLPYPVHPDKGQLVDFSLSEKISSP